MSITSRLFQKAVKVLRRDGQGSKRRLATNQAPAIENMQRMHFLEPLESRLLMSTVTIAAVADATEGGADGTFRISRDDTVGDLEVRFSTSGKARLGATKDYTLNDGVLDLTKSVIIPDGLAFVDVTVVAVDDVLAEPTEVITLKLSSNKAYDLSPDFSLRSADIDLIDNEPVVTIAATDALADEDGDTGTFTITRTGNTTGDLEVKFKRSGNAKFGTDYGLTVNGIALTSTTVVILDGDATVEVVVVPINDSKHEPTEVVSFTLRSSKAYTLGGDVAASVLIADNEPLIFIDPASTAPTSFVIDNQNNLGADTFITTGLEAAETHDAGPVFVQFARDGLLLINQGDALQVRNAQGIDGVNSSKAYVSFDLSLFPFDTFSNAVFTLTLIDIIGASPNNTNFTFNVFGIRDDFVPTGTVQNEDWNEDINYGDAPGNVPDGGLVDLTAMFGAAPLGSFNIIGTGGVGQKVSISGQQLTDFLNAESLLDADGDNLVTFVIVRENIGAPNDTVIHGFDGRDDPFGDATTRPQLTGFGLQAGQTVLEGDLGTIRVFRAGSSVGDVTVDFKTKGAARLGIDYTLEVNGTPVTSSFIIPDGDAFVDINIITIDDGFYEIPETIELTLRSSAAYSLEAQATSTTVTIVDNEPVVSVVATDDTAQEPDITTAALNRGTFTFTRTGDITEDLAVNVKISGQAKDGKDFVKIGKTIIIPAGSDTVDITIDPLADDIPEGDEDVTITILPGTGYGMNFLVNGTRTATGNVIRPTVIAAANIKDARKAAKNQGIGGAVVTTPAQNATITIQTGNPANGPDLTGLLYQLAGNNIDNDTVGGALGTAKIINQGKSIAGPFNVTFFLSDDRNLDVLDFELSTVTIQSLLAGNSIDVGILFDDLTGLLAGRYYVIAQIDVDGFVSESIENNNTLISILNEVVVVN